MYFNHLATRYEYKYKKLGWKSKRSMIIVGWDVFPAAPAFVVEDTIFKHF